MSVTPTNALKPKALIFSTNPDKELESALEKYGVQANVVSDPKIFLTTLNGTSPSISFIVANADQIKIVRALLKSIRKVLGVALPVYVVAAEADVDGSDDLQNDGASGILLRPLDKAVLVEILKRNVATDEIASAASPEAAVTEEVPVATTAIKIPATASWIFDTVFPIMATMSTVLENLDESETKVKFYSEKIVTYRDLFVKMVNAMRRGGDEQPLDVAQCVRFYGIVNVKKFVVADKLLEAVKGQGFKWNETTSRPDEDPSKLIAFAIALQDHFGEDSLYREAAFNSGLVFDMLSLMAESTGERKAALKKEISAAAKRAMDRADAGINRAKSQKSVPLVKHIVTSNLMTEAAKMVLAIHYSDYLDTLKALDKAKARSALIHIVEEKKFGVSHNVLGALLCQVTPGLSAAARGVLMARYPFMLSQGGAKNTDLSSLAEIVATS